MALKSELRPEDWEVEELVEGSRRARVFSPSNIALAKYWGKRNLELNLPTNGSVSISLKHFGSFTTVEFHESFRRDRLILNGEEETPDRILKVRTVLDELRALAGCKLKARVQSANNFPTAAGLASSASGLSAVTLAGARALGLDAPARGLSAIARQGSGSACRSLFGGFVEWKRGEKADGSDSRAVALAPVSHWKLVVLIAVVSHKQKAQASTGGMELTRKTSPYFKAWVESAEKQCAEIRSAILEKNFIRLADLTESNCMRMHASAMAAFPPILYWQAQTLEVMQRVRELRADGVPVFFTIDAGPNVVLVMEPEALAKVQRGLNGIEGLTLLKTEIGEGSRELGGRDGK